MMPGQRPGIYAGGVSALYAWLRRHPKLVDGVLAAVLAFAGVPAAVSMDRPLLAVAAIGLAVPVVFRRAHPVGGFATVIIIGALQVLFDLRAGPTDLSVVVMLYTLAAYTPRRTSVPGLLICLGGSAAGVLRWWAPHPAPPLTWLLAGFTVFAGPSVLAWVLGDSMRYRRAYYASLEERAARLEAERGAQAQIAAAAERARIARELHDVVAHNVSVMVVQADGASYALHTDPGRAADALAAISSTGRQALAEMRRLLGILRRDEEAVRAPLPGIGQLGELLESTRAAGLPVSFTVEGVPQPLAGGAALAAYRIVQESLTNTRKHAGPQATAEVALCYLEDALVLEITDDGRGAAARPDGAGHGLTGMAERVAMYGGSLEAGPRSGGGYRVRARLPVVAGPGTPAVPRTAAGSTAAAGPATAAPPGPATQAALPEGVSPAAALPERVSPAGAA
jgi:signal transduction histidine kinase